MSQPIIRGIQAVGAVDIWYVYNSSDGRIPLGKSISIGGRDMDYIDTSKGIKIAGFRLDGEFLRAVQQVASSVQIPILGGGAVALTNNNRSGQLSINCTRVSTPVTGKKTYDQDVYSTGEPPVLLHKAGEPMGTEAGAMMSGNGVGVEDGQVVYDLTLIAQAQQAQPGGDSVGATITVSFQFNGLITNIIFEGCTIASVDPIGLSGNDAVNYNVAINYLNWKVDYSASSTTVAGVKASS